MKKTIAIFIEHPKCSIQSANGVISSLHNHYRFKIFTKHELEKNFFDDVDIVCVPGGLGDADFYNSTLKRHEQKIKNFVSSGGKYLGICMGAYWADKHYLNLLDNVQVVQYIKQDNVDTRRPHAKNMPIIWNNSPMNMFFYDGCTYIGNNFKTVAKYSTGHPMAIVQRNIGLIGCHPESDKHWYDSYSWMKKHWHEDTHKELLLNFVNEL